MKAKERMMDTITLIRNSVVELDEDGINHKRRLLDLQDIKNWERVKLDLMDNDFRYYIKAGELAKLKYHALVRSRFHSRYLLDYTGDIPDFAISRAEIAISFGIRDITIHSMQLLPVNRLKGDPVLVGWMSQPEQAVWEGYNLDKNIEGVVIAVWDNEKELEL